MKWTVLLAMMMIGMGCAHQFHQDRSISSVEEQQQDRQMSRAWVEPRGAR